MSTKTFPILFFSTILSTLVAGCGGDDPSFQEMPREITLNFVTADETIAESSDLDPTIGEGDATGEPGSQGYDPDIGGPTDPGSDDAGGGIDDTGGGIDDTGGGIDDTADSSGSGGGDVADSGSAGGASDPFNNPDQIEDDEFDDSDTAVTTHEARVCGEAMKASKVVVAGNKNSQTITLSSQTAIAVKVAGNQTTLRLNLDVNKPVSIRGVCLFVTGNRARVMGKIGVGVARLFYIGRGNQSYSDLEVTANGRIDSSLFDLAGNGAKVDLRGAGQYSCGDAIVRGNAQGLVCP